MDRLSRPVPSDRLHQHPKQPIQACGRVRRSSNSPRCSGCFMHPVARAPSAAASAPQARATAAPKPQPVLDRFFETPLGAFGLIQGLGLMGKAQMSSVLPACVPWVPIDQPRPSHLSPPDSDGASAMLRPIPPGLRCWDTEYPIRTRRCSSQAVRPGKTILHSGSSRAEARL